MTGLVRPAVGLAQEVGQAAHVGRHLSGIAGQPRRLLDHARHGRRVERPLLGASGEGRDEAGVECVRLGCPVHPVVEVGLHLEQLEEVGVEFAQHVVEEPVAHQRDLHVERDGLRLERDRADESEGLAQRLDADPAGP